MIATQSTQWRYTYRLFFDSRKVLVYPFAKVWHSLEEELVGVSSLVRSMMDTGKAVQIQLTQEALILSLVEVLRHDRQGKSMSIEDLEGRATGHPTYDIVESLFGRIF